MNFINLFFFSFMDCMIKLVFRKNEHSRQLSNMVIVELSIIVFKYFDSYRYAKPSTA